MRYMIDMINCYYDLKLFSWMQVTWYRLTGN
jgi:hypothetical protein